MASTRIHRWGFAAGGVAALALGAGARVGWPPCWSGRAPHAAVAQAAEDVALSPRSVAARGRLQPAGGVIRVAGPSRPAVVETLHVHEGDWVEAGQAVAVLDGVAAQRAALQRLDAEAQHAATDLQRMTRLYRDGIVSAAERDAAQLRADVARAERARAQAELDAASVRAPNAGRVLTIHTHPGERIGADGVLDLGNTAQMEVVAEVYETEIAAVRVGQPATVTAAALSAPLLGAVERVGLTIGRLSVFAVDPAADTDARVVEVHIRLDGAERVAALTNLQVDVDLAL